MNEYMVKLRVKLNSTVLNEYMVKLRVKLKLFLVEVHSKLQFI